MMISDNSAAKMDRLISICGRRKEKLQRFFFEEELGEEPNAKTSAVQRRVEIYQTAAERHRVLISNLNCLFESHFVSV